MQTKTYFASSVPAALEVARKELGAEALLVNSKLAPEAARMFGRLEVTFAFDPQAAPPAVEPPSIRPVNSANPFGALRLAFADLDRTGPENPVSERPRVERPRADRQAPSELDAIRDEIMVLRAAIGGTSDGAPSGKRIPDEAGLAVICLCAAGLREDSAREIADAAARRLGLPGQDTDMQSALRQELASRIPHASFAPMKNGENRTLAFMGPSGRGKTTTLIKIAVRFGIALRIPVRIYGAGAHGVGGQEQLARYATILGVPFQACESLESLSLALNGDAWKGLALIDTPGISLADTAGIAELAKFFSRRSGIEKHLVLRADARSADMLHAVSRFSALEPSRLLFTGVEEALSVGAMVDTLVRTRIPATFAGTGQEIPADLEEVEPAALARLVCGETGGARPGHQMPGGQNALAAVAA